MMKFKTYEIRLTTEDPFRIGGKPDYLSAAENAVTVVGDRLCIPGSSLKGAYRAELERYLSALHSGSGASESILPCIPATSLSPDEEELVRKKRFKGKGCTYPSGRGRGAQGGKDSSICPACYLLGAQGMVGFVKVPFLFASREASQEYLYSSSIDRATQVVEKGTNRPYQYVPPGTLFTGELEVLLEDPLLDWKLGEPRPLKENEYADAWLLENVGWTQERILKELIEDRLKNIRQLGGYRSKGFGKVSIELSPKT